MKTNTRTFFGDHPADIELVDVNIHKHWQARLRLPVGLDAAGYAAVAGDAWQALAALMADGWVLVDDKPIAVHEERYRDGQPFMNMILTAWLVPA